MTLAKLEADALAWGCPRFRFSLLYWASAAYVKSIEWMPAIHVLDAMMKGLG
ncbi:hypothetical protein X760_22505 [Mesorhizobium sp. LSHC422A00]|nr:hypothetical protein X771_29005 [Mesorhizobium sp. LSJC277A00]ESX21010.1 hypothetical protein X766_06335 [Mesorhizobium sp. LSJC255A00]ESX46896.1 hypothetical protein X762_20425 [Mesorhizobium sp. LSHC426A00]ESX57000.1 hypothetical protein X760_22505 [Mesorhizobium sp. LSHC422A00]ESX72283.1 hypothetical protein X758_12330 [Mesorhizobium sp. LSHC416B00]ESX78546.1 hypothetical protein X757_09705 [Mesorhizobium sp. LSHC414A00]